jgi:hypothetical protein
MSDESQNTYTLGDRAFTIAKVTPRRMSRFAMLFGAKSMTDIAHQYLGQTFDESRDKLDHESALVLDSNEKLTAALGIFFVEPVPNEYLEYVGASQLVEIIRDFWTGSAPSAVVELVTSKE